MRKQSVITVIVIFAILAAGGLLQAKYQKPRLYIKGGKILNLTKGGHYGDLLDARDVALTTLSNDDQYTLNWTQDSNFSGWGGEIGIETEKHAVGLNVGFIKRSFSLTSDYRETGGNYGLDLTWDYEFKAMPIFLLVHYKLINSRYIKAFLSMGPGVYIIKYKDLRQANHLNYDYSSETTLLECRKNQIGVHFGVSVDVNITKNIALFVDAGYRMVKFDELEATLYYEVDSVFLEGEGPLYFNVDPTTKDARFVVEDPDNAPPESIPAVLDLNGLNLSVGIKLIL